MRGAFAAVLVSLTAMGCSLIARPTRGSGAPALDAVVAVAALGGCAAAAISDEVRDHSVLIPNAIICVPLVPLALLYGLSSLYGFNRMLNSEPVDETTVRPQTDPADDERARSRAKAWEMTKAAATAATAGDCETARKIDPQVLYLDADFHTTVFAENVAIKRCLAPAAD